MALNHDHIMLSPRCLVHWAGFESNTQRMQHAGWEFAVEAMRDMYAMRDYLNVALRHRDTGWAGQGRIDMESARNAALYYSTARMMSQPFSNDRWERPDPVLEITRMGMDNHRMYDSTVYYQRVDMSPKLVMMPAAEIGRTLHELGVFRPWAPKAEEIIVEPQTVASMLEQIKKMQAGDLAEIRKRNAAREAREQRQENVVCQVIAMAA